MSPAPLEGRREHQLQHNDISTRQMSTEATSLPPVTGDSHALCTVLCRFSNSLQETWVRGPMLSWCLLWGKVSPRTHLHPCPKGSREPSPLMTEGDGPHLMGHSGRGGGPRPSQGRAPCTRGEPGGMGTQKVLGRTGSPKPQVHLEL